ncbi:MAG: hypothetical protein QGF20_14790 [Alphaproteobacteria bacterium]|nr:hypothetical protein [Alphaproteobacteria bacterium]
MTVRQLLAGRPLAPLCSLLAALWLTACVTDGATSSVVDQGLDQAALPAKAIEPVTLRTANAPAAGAQDDAMTSRPAPPSRVAALPEPPPNTPPRQTPDLQQLVGMSRGGLSGLLGKPTLRRSEPPAEVWQYGAAKCVLHVFLYNDTAEGRYRVSHVDVVRRRQRGIDAGAASGETLQQECFGRVLHRATAQNQAG